MTHRNFDESRSQKQRAARNPKPAGTQRFREESWSAGSPLPLFIPVVFGACLLAGCLSHGQSPAPPNASPVSTFFVATNGNDAWSGTLPVPNRKKTDGPFATPVHALQAVRQARRDGTSRKPIKIGLRNGTYFVTTPLTVYPEDSGLTISAYKGEKPIVSGGRRITNWNEVTIQNRKFWTADLPEVREGTWYFHQLWVNGQRATRARHPNKGYLKIASLPDSTPEWSQGQTRFAFHEGDIKASPSITNAEVIAMTRWVESRLPITSVDETNHIVSFGRKSVFQLAADDPYYIENAFEFLDEPGEWYLDQSAGSLYYLPRPGEKPEQIEAIAPVLSQVVRLEARSGPATNSSPSPPSEERAGERRPFFQNVSFRGITFSHTEWYFPSGFRGGTGKPSKKPPPPNEPGGFAQAAVGVPGAVWGEGIRNCSFENCSFRHLGTYGLELGKTSASNHVLGCEFSDLGAGGIKIGATAIDQNEPTRANEISDCHIHDGGKLFASAVGIWIGQSPDNRLTHNLIHDFFYTGISIGWTWGYGATAATNNLIAFNHVHHIGVKSEGDGPILSDMGGIYTLGMQPGTKIINNLWHDISGLRYGGWGIYLDEGSSSVLVASNVVYRTTHGGFHQHYGATNVLRNNIFAFARDQQLQRTRPEPHISFSFETNIVYFDSGVLLGGNWGEDRYRVDWNLYFDSRAAAKTNSINFAGATLDQWRQRGHDAHSIVTDPLFIAPDKDDFRLRPDSPALRYGFQPIQLDNVGPRASAQFSNNTR
jgi:parallel beta-helix repeat protein